jgi:CBS domain containing-hemolysin-like protein
VPSDRRCRPIEIALGLALVALLIFANGFFVAAEFSLVAVDRDRVDALAETGGRRARRAAWAIRRLSFNLSGAQLGITVTSLVLGFIAEPTVARAIDPAFEFLPEAARNGVAIAVALALVTVLQMVVGELVPKGIAVAEPLRLTVFLSPAIWAYATVFGPLIKLFNGSADWVVRRLGIEPREELRSVRTIDELELLISSSGKEGTLDPQAFNLLTRAIRFGHKEAVNAMVPRVDVATISADATVAELARLALGTGHSRFPVTGANADDVLGVVHAKDVLRVPSHDRDQVHVRDLTVPATFIPEGRDLESLLTEMRAGAVQLAVVVDEYGGIAGVVTLEDILEEIVGDIEDEYDAVPTSVTPAIGAAGAVVEGSLHLDEVREAVGVDLPEGPYETLAGFLLAELGHVPVAGERVRWQGWQFEILDMDRRRIATVGVMAPPEAR